MKPVPIEDYALIGDMRTAALVSRDGSIDWFCCPRFDSAACFAALLGGRDHGRWQICPTGNYTVTRCYRDAGLVLETTFETPGGGRAQLIDFMPVEGEDSSIIRIVRGLSGSVDFSTDLAIRMDYGRSVPWVNRLDETTMQAIAGPWSLTLRTVVELHGEDLHTVGDFRIERGEAVSFVLTSSPSHRPVPLPLSVASELANTEKFWERWSQLCRLEGRWADAIRRSLVTLKALSYRPTGGIVAAATTSLPEALGGERNWDYRYCWLRDATYTLLAFLNAGHTEEASAWEHWLMRAVAGSPDQMQTMYGVAGERYLPEQELDWLPGYAGSRPVRVGNAAATQLQLDIYGELAHLVEESRTAGLVPGPRRSELRRMFLEHLAGIWREPDEGIWEIRGPRRHFTHSKAMCWLAFAGAARSPDEGDTPEHLARWQAIADEIHADILANAIDPDTGGFTQYYGSRAVDASLLQLAIVGFLPPDDARIRATVESIETHLLRDNLVYRYETGTGVDGLHPGEGAFLACSFWLVDNYRLMGRRADAERLYGHLLGLANDVGLLAEEFDPKAGRMLGNFPQAFSHVALVNAGLGLLDGQAD